MTKRLTIAGIIFSMLCCLRAAYGQTDLDIAIAIAITEIESTPLPELPVTFEQDSPLTGGAVAPSAVAAGKKPPPVLDADSLPADQQPTPMAGVSAMIDTLGPLANKRLVVYGSGADARIEITAARRDPTLKVIGIEIDPDVADSARRYVAQAGLASRITILTGDAITSNIEADLGAASLWPETLGRLAPKIRKHERFASFAHAVPGLSMQQRGDVYVYQKPRPVVLRPVVQARPQTVGGALWNGRVYSRPVCNSPRCAMCAAIRRQLRY